MYSVMCGTYIEYNFKMHIKTQIKKLLIAALVALCSSVAITMVFQYLFLVRLP